MELKRTIEQWRGGDPEAMAYHMSEAAIMYAFKDAKADILALHSENERLRAALAEANKVLTVEDSLNPHYGWAEWLDEHIRPLVTPNTEGKRSDD